MFLLKHKQVRPGIEKTLILFDKCLETVLRNDLPWVTLYSK